MITEQVEAWEYVTRAFAGQSRGAGWYRVACPRCFEMEGKVDYKRSLGYNSKTGGYNCFKCNLHGILPLRYRAQLSEVDEFLLGKEPIVSLNKPEPVQLAVGFAPVFSEENINNPAFDWARKYLTGPRGQAVNRGAKARGLQPENCRAAYVGAVCFGYLAGRIVVPIPDYSDSDAPWRGWVSREAIMGVCERPYIYPKHMNRLGLLYNELALYEHTDEPVYVVEGTLDAVALWPNAVAVLGKPLESQLELLAKANRPVVVCLDGDAWEQGQALAWQLSWRGVRAGNIRLPPKTDPDEVPLEWLKAEAKQALK